MGQQRHSLRQGAWSGLFGVIRVTPSWSQGRVLFITLQRGGSIPLGRGFASAWGVIVNLFNILIAIITLA
ncbi:hypothetical protein DSO57_1037948 [Entomophthora muscae]|uniref:Uncharacterized protein n=1 Tax=Entomophthora muscae TaxID=34485 RepID=A0ACC2SBS0_9FUNG|nr:hypothetical protein DSO57_1037948 [Entomophthora muscae]